MENYIAKKRANELMELYSNFGGADYIGEPVSQIEHMCQAAQFAIDEGYDDEVILAAFLHDVGHFFTVDDSHASMNGFGTVDHEKIGAYHLDQMGFSSRLCRLIVSHVQAKRYLTFKDPNYYNKLSEASKQTLLFQGGRMIAQEAADFEKDELFETFIRMRLWDEAAKVENTPLPSLDYFKDLMIAHLELEPQLKNA